MQDAKTSAGVEPCFVCLLSLVMHAQSAADVHVHRLQAFKEARDAMADAAARRPLSAAAGDNQEVARVLRYSQ